MSIDVLAISLVLERSTVCSIESHVCVCVGVVICRLWLDGVVMFECRYLFVVLGLVIRRAG